MAAFPCLAYHYHHECLNSHLMNHCARLEPKPGVRSHTHSHATHRVRETPALANEHRSGRPYRGASPKSGEPKHPDETALLPHLGLPRSMEGARAVRRHQRRRWLL
jgi:hypothetical protein